MKTQSSVMINEAPTEFTEFRKGVDELIKLVDTFKESNFRDLVTLVNSERDRKQKQK